MIDSENRVWIGTYLGGITLMDTEIGKTSNFVNIGGQPNSLADDIVNHIFEDSRGRVWVATHKGVSMFVSEKGEFRNYFQLPGADVNLSFANRIVEDLDGNIWISTFDNGIFKYNPETEDVSRYFYTGSNTGPADKTINTVYCDDKGRVWIGSLGGLSLYVPGEDSFVNFNKSHGLTDNAILSIIDDDRGNVWLGTNNSLTKFNPEIESFTNFNKNDGLVHDVFQINAVYKNKSGTLYFGSKNGLVFFNANQIDNLKSSAAPTVHFTSLKIFDEYINPGVGSIIERPVNNIEKITLKHSESFITLGFSTLNFINPFSDRFSYYLEGYDYGWIDVKNNNSLTYTRIPPGKYKLHVKATNTLHNVSAIKTIDLIIKPPFWRSGWSYLIYFIVFGIMIYVAYSYVKSRNVYRQSLLLERFEKEKNNEINQSKIRFFINVAHEFKTPLTLILSPLEKLLKQEKELNDDSRMKLTGLVYRNAQILSRLVNQVMDLRRIDTGSVKLMAQETDIIVFLNELSEYFFDYAQNHGISFSFSSNHSSLMVWLDHEKAEKIFLNILSNAFKYTPDGKSVAVNISVVEEIITSEKHTAVSAEFVSVEITDTGKGIASEHLDKIFDRFYQVSESQIANPSSSGIGLSIVKEYVEMHKGFTQIESQPGEGTTLTILLPLGDDHLQPDERILQDLITNKKGFLREKAIVPTYSHEPVSDSSKAIKILVVEDNYELRNYIVDSLNEEFDVYEASDGEEGLKIAIDVLPKTYSQRCNDAKNEWI
jgi:signal transduction histidine kinase/streptogramin lyase